MEKKLSVVVSVYNEEQALPMFYETTKLILEILPWDYELLFVNDGSRDDSLSILREYAARDEKVKFVSFSRNFGHEAAMIAGIDYADGDGIVCMDADLQHPPECLPEIVRKFEEGCGVISMVRTKNKSAGLIKNITSAGFYRVINALSDVKFEPNASDFFAISKEAAEVLRKNYREKVRFLRGYVQVQYQKTAGLFPEHDHVLLQSAAEAWHLCRGFCGPAGGGGNDLHAVHPSGRAQRLRYHCNLKLLYVCDSVSDRGHYRGVHRDSVQRTEGPANLYRGRNTECGEKICVREKKIRRSYSGGFACSFR